MLKRFTIFLLLISGICMATPAQAQNPRRMCATIKTTAECEFCKQNIEETLGKVKGIRKVKVDFKKHEVYVNYNSKKITLDQIRKELNDLGYDADDQKANFDKFKKSEHDK